MKITTSDIHNRTLRVTGLPTNHPDDPTELLITVGYVGDASAHRAVALDGTVIPFILAACAAYTPVNEMKLDLQSVTRAMGQDLVHVYCDGDGSWLSEIIDGKCVFRHGRQNALAMPRSVAEKEAGGAYRMICIVDDLGDAGVPFRVTRGYTLEALIQDLRLFKGADAGEVNLDAESSHPETDDECTIGDLIAPAAAELAAMREANAKLRIALINMMHQTGGIARAFNEAQQAVDATKEAR